MALLLAYALAVSTALPQPSPVAAGAGSVTGRVSISKNGAQLPDASNCVVWIQGARRPAGAPAAPPRIEMKSQGKRFVPRVVAVEKNAEVDFPNADSIYHNVFSVSPANRFDLGLYRSGGSKAKKFEEAGLVRVYCNIHPQMVGFVLVVDSDFFTVTGPDGSFRFENVPAGNWELHGWNEEGDEARVPLVVRARAENKTGIELDATEFKPQPHKNKYGKDYPPNAGNQDERY